MVLNEGLGIDHVVGVCVRVDSWRKILIGVQVC